MDIEEKLDKLIELQQIQCDDKNKDQFYEKWEFWFALFSFITLWLFLFTNAYSMNGVYCPHFLSTFLNWFGGML